MPDLSKLTQDQISQIVECIQNEIDNENDDIHHFSEQDDAGDIAEKKQYINQLKEIIDILEN